MIHIAERLLATDVTAHEFHILAVPRQILAIELRVVDCNIVALPERVLGRNLGMVNLYVLAVLEYIFGIAHQSVHIDVLGEHERIGAFVKFHILELQSVYTPESFVSIIDFDPLQREVLHLTEELRAVDDGVFHHHIIAVPDGRTATLGKVTVGDEAAVYVPPGIFAVETGVVALQVFAALDA